jgi:hypothetical protein
VPPLNDITERVFRPNPAYRYQARDSVANATVKELISRPGVAGVLRATTGETKIVGEEVAVLYSGLTQATRLSASLLEKISHRSAANVVLAALVLDKILEVESDGGYVSGVEAHAVMFGKRSGHEPREAVSLLSVEALKYGQALRLSDAYLLAGRLYCFNRRPASSSWRFKLPSRQSVAEYLGEANGDWTRAPAEPERPEWLIWRAKAAPGRSPGEPQYKLYISPEPAYLRESLSAALPALTASGAHAFKTGADLHGILRPDKFVAYFSNRERMFEAGLQIGSRLSGVPAQGVPFTAGLEGGGIVSWGIDPPAHAVVFPWSGRSWRCWLTDRLAAALIVAGSDAAPVPAWEFALDRLRLDGVDPANWEPDAALWRAKESTA